MFGKSEMKIIRSCQSESRDAQMAEIIESMTNLIAIIFGNEFECFVCGGVCGNGKVCVCRTHIGKEFVKELYEQEDETE